MKRYNREKRAGYKTHTRARKHAQREGYKPQIHARYEGYKRIEYIAEYARGRDTHEQIYVNTTNAINAIFPDINAPHNAQTHLPRAPYRQRIPEAPRNPRTRPEYESTQIHTDTRKAKCMIYDRYGILIYFGIIRRTREIREGELHITLHKGDRHIEAYAYVPADKDIYGYTIQQLRAHNIEFYHI